MSFCQIPYIKTFLFTVLNKMNLALHREIGHNQEFNIMVRLSADQAGCTLFLALIIILQILRCSAPNNNIRKNDRVAY